MLCIGKKSSWTAKSFLEVGTLAAFVFVGPGNVYLYVGLGCLAGIPLDALGPELSNNYVDRSSIYFINGLYIGIGTLLAIVLPLLIESNILDFSEIKTVSCLTDVCFSPNGQGKACIKDFDTNLLNNYALFDPMLGRQIPVIHLRM